MRVSIIQKTKSRPKWPRLAIVGLRQDATATEKGDRRRGLTIVELLAATTLATMLVGAVLGILNRIAQQQTILLGNDRVEPWQIRAAQLLEWDLVNSQSLRTTPEGIQLEGFASRHFGTNAPLQRPAIVGYTIVRRGERSYLMRSEIQQDSLALKNRKAELVGLGIDRIIATSPGANFSKEDDGVVPDIASLPDGPIPARLTVIALSGDPGKVVFRHDFKVR